MKLFGMVPVSALPAAHTTASVRVLCWSAAPHGPTHSAAWHASWMARGACALLQRMAAARAAVCCLTGCSLSPGAHAPLPDWPDRHFQGRTEVNGCEEGGRHQAGRQSPSQLHVCQQQVVQRVLHHTPQADNAAQAQLQMRPACCAADRHQDQACGRRAAAGLQLTAGLLAPARMSSIQMQAGETPDQAWGCTVLSSQTGAAGLGAALAGPSGPLRPVLPTSDRDVRLPKTAATLKTFVTLPCSRSISKSGIHFSEQPLPDQAIFRDCLCADRPAATLASSLAESVSLLSAWHEMHEAERGRACGA